MEDKGGKRLARNRADAARNDTAQGKMPAADVPESGAAPVQSRWKRLWSDYGYLLVTLAVVVLIFRVLLQLAYVPSGSMETTLPTKSVLVGLQLPYIVADPVPQRGDIVTFWSDELGKVLVKRVIGLPGDTITFADGYVYVNGEKLEEEYLPVKGVTECDKSFTVPEGCFFPMGDNRTGSNDARSWANPYVKVSAIQAKPFLVISVGSDQSWQGIRLVGQGGRS